MNIKDLNNSSMAVLFLTAGLCFLLDGCSGSRPEREYTLHFDGDNSVTVIKVDPPWPVAEGDTTTVESTVNTRAGQQAQCDSLVRVDVEPVVLERVEPDYPEELMKAGSSGEVVVKAWVDRNGNIKKAGILSTTNTAFNRVSLKAVVQWRFTPAILDGKPVDVWISIPFRFRVRPR